MGESSGPGGIHPELGGESSSPELGRDPVAESQGGTSKEPGGAKKSQESQGRSQEEPEEPGEAGMSKEERQEEPAGSQTKFPARMWT